MEKSGEFGFVLDGEFHQRVAAMDLQLVGDIGAVILNRAHADAQAGSNLFDLCFTLHLMYTNPPDLFNHGS